MIRKLYIENYFTEILKSKEEINGLFNFLFKYIKKYNFVKVNCQNKTKKLKIAMESIE